MKKTVYFLTGSQHLYGSETISQAAADGRKISEYLNGQKDCPVAVAALPILTTADEVTAAIKKANYDDACVGIITWMHTFSPGKMWIEGLRLLQKPYLHFHTQANEKLPYGTIDMDFMNLNQSAHGDREHGFIVSRLRINRTVAAGYYKDPDTLAEIFDWALAAVAYDFSRNLKVARFGDNMREVAVTEGDKVEAQLKFGWQVHGYGVGDLAAYINEVTEQETDAAFDTLKKEYTINTDNLTSVKEQLKYEIAMRRFFADKKIGAFTNTFEDLHGFKQLPGLATQRLMADGIGFGAEGDWKTAALGAVMQKFAHGKPGATGFMEDYTYDLTKGEELVLGAHMLEVPPAFAANKPSVEVHPLGIGGKEPPARLVFDGITGEGIAVTVVDMGNRFRMIVAEIELVKQPEPMPKLPVARVMWKLKPDFKTGAAAWILAGGAHHTVVSTALTAANMRTLAAMYGIECVVIGNDTQIERLRKELLCDDVIYGAR